METTQPQKLTRKEKIAQGLPKKNTRKSAAAQARKEIQAAEVKAALRKEQTSPRKMRLLADQIRMKNVSHAMAILKLSPRAASRPLLKLLQSALSNWEAKHQGRFDEDTVFIREIMVDSSTMLKRFLPAPQGRAYRLRKRSNHVTIVLDTLHSID